MPPLDPKVIQVYAKYVFPLRAGPNICPHVLSPTHTASPLTRAVELATFCPITALVVCQRRSRSFRG